MPFSQRSGIAVVACRRAAAAAAAAATATRQPHPIDQPPHLPPRCTGSFHSRIIQHGLMQPPNRENCNRSADGLDPEQASAAPAAASCPT